MSASREAMEAELAAMKDRITGFNAFIGTEAFNALHESVRAALIAQRETMERMAAHVQGRLDALNTEGGS